MRNKIIHYFNSKAFSLVDYAIAIPAYKTYVIKAKFAELITAVDPYKVETVQAFYDTGAPPSNRSDFKNTALVYNVELWQNNDRIYSCASTAIFP